MALQKLAAGDRTDDTRSKINAAFAAIDSALDAIAGDGVISSQIQAVRVDLSQLRDAFVQESHDRQEADSVIRGTIDSGFASVNGTLQAVAQTAADSVDDERQDRIKALSDAVATLTGLVEQETAARLASAPPSTRRPGDGPQSFTRGAFAGKNLPPLPASMIAVNENGFVARVQGADIIASRRLVAVEIGRRYRPRFVVQRRRNVADPSSHAIRCGVAWLDQSGQLLRGSAGVTVVRDLLRARTSDGRIQVGTTMARFGVGATLSAPAGAVYGVTFVQTFGDDGVTDIEVMDLVDVTDLAVLPDFSADLAASVQALEGQGIGSRLQLLETAQGSPNSPVYPTRGDAAAANVPATATTLATKGLNAAGDGQSALYRRGTQAEAATSNTSFRSADGAYWMLSETLTSRVQIGRVGTEIVTYFGGSRAVNDAASVGAYDATADILIARGKPGYNGDDAPALNVVLLTKVAVCLQPIGLNLKTTILMPLYNQRLCAVGGLQTVYFTRDGAHVTDTLQAGTDTQGAGSCVIEDIWFVHPGRILYSSGALPNKLTGNQAHIRIKGGQKPRIRGGGYGCVHFIVFEGGSGLSTRELFIYGGVNDPKGKDANGQLWANEAISHIYLKHHPVHGWPKTVHIESLELLTNASPARDFTVGDKTLHGYESIGPLYLLLLESYEDVVVSAGFTGGASIANIAVLPKPDSVICANLQVIGGFHDESTFSNILIRRDSDAAPMVSGVKVKGVDFNGQLRTLHAIVIDGSTGRFAARNVHVEGNKTNAHLGTPFIFSGVDNGKCLNNTLQGYNSAYTTNGDAVNCAGVLIYLLTRDFHCEGNTYGGGINEYDGAEITAARYGRFDLTPANQNNTFRNERLAYQGTRGASNVAALNQAPGTLNTGGIAA